MDFPETTSFTVKIEVTSAYLGDLLSFIHQKYIVPFYRNFINVKRWVEDGREALAFTFLDPHGLWYVNVEVVAGNPIEVKMTPSSREVPQTVLNRIKEDLIVTIQLFEESIRRTTLYFAWVPGRSVVPERMFSKRRRVLSQIFTGNMLSLFIIFIIFSYLTFLAVGWQRAPIILVIIQFFIVLFSDKIFMRMGDWTITAETPYVHILQYHIPPEEFESFRRRYTRDHLLQIKKEIYDRTLSLGRPLDSQTVQEIFSTYGINIRHENLLTKTVNVYRIVKEAAEHFSIPVPKIAIANMIIPNAATTGLSPRLGLVLITTGLLVQLDEEEIFAVIGHEISHLKSRDPLALFTLSSIEYLLRVYYLWQFVFYLGFLYFFFALGVIYFIAKFFEARADLESAVKIGRPKILASALIKIGFRRIRFERVLSTRIGRWLGMDPHPPVSFRIERLEGLSEPWKIKHPFLRSMKDCINGLLKELKKI